MRKTFIILVLIAIPLTLSPGCGGIKLKKGSKAKLGKLDRKSKKRKILVRKDAILVALAPIFREEYIAKYEGFLPDKPTIFTHFRKAMNTDPQVLLVPYSPMKRKKKARQLASKIPSPEVTVKTETYAQEFVGKRGKKSAVMVLRASIHSRFRKYPITIEEKDFLTSRKRLAQKVARQVHRAIHKELTSAILASRIRKKGKKVKSKKKEDKSLYRLD